MGWVGEPFHSRVDLCSSILRTPPNSICMSNTSSSRCKGEVGWGGWVKPFHSRVDMCSSILGTRTPPNPMSNTSNQQ